MAYLYLFQLEKITSPSSSNRNYAIISSNKNNHFENIIQGSITSAFNEFGLQVDFVRYKEIIPFSTNIFNIIVETQKPTDKLKIVVDNRFCYLSINNKKTIPIATLLTLSNNHPLVEYPFVGIYTK